MLTEFHGDSVAGGTYPAEIWKAFMERALKYLRAEPESFDSPTYPYTGPRSVVYRDGKLELDNGYCRNAREVLLFAGEGPDKEANCKPNEVDVPSVVGQTLAAARARLAAQPLTAAYVYRPAAPRQRLGVVLSQFPARGTLSSYDKVTLVLAKPLHGVVPRLVGLTVGRAERQLSRLHLVWRISGSAEAGAKIVRQSPRAGVAAAPRMFVRLVVGHG